MKSLKGRDIISIDDFNRSEILYIFKIAKKYEKKVNPNLLKGKIVATLFFEPSTRTHQSFSSAAQRLGAGVIGFSNISSTSINKGESFSDTLKIMEGYSDLLVLRHPDSGSAKIAADTLNIPVINAGDGPNHHPTQTLLDLYTIQKKFKRLNNLKIAFVGDPKHYRTFHGLVLGLNKFGTNKIYGISPKGLEMPPEFKNPNYIDDVIDMRKLNKNLSEIKPDVICAGRIPKEYIKGDAGKYSYKIDQKTLSILPNYSIIMHPLPRAGEIDPLIDSSPMAVYFEQAKNGLYIRMALLALILGTG